MLVTLVLVGWVLFDLYQRNLTVELKFNNNSAHTVKLVKYERVNSEISDIGKFCGVSSKILNKSF